MKVCIFWDLEFFNGAPKNQYIRLSTYFLFRLSYDSSPSDNRYTCYRRTIYHRNIVLTGSPSIIMCKGGRPSLGYSTK